MPSQYGALSINTWSTPLLTYTNFFRACMCLPSHVRRARQRQRAEPDMGSFTQELRETTHQVLLRHSRTLNCSRPGAWRNALNAQFNTDADRRIKLLSIIPAPLLRQYSRPLSNVFGQLLALFVPQLIKGEVFFQESLNPSDLSRGHRSGLWV